MTTPESKIKIVDSWAIIGWIGDEPGASAMQGMLERAESGEIQLFMSVLNVGETFYILPSAAVWRLPSSSLTLLPRFRSASMSRIVRG